MATAVKGQFGLVLNVPKGHRSKNKRSIITFIAFDIHKVSITIMYIRIEYPL